MCRPHALIALAAFRRFSGLATSATKQHPSPLPDSKARGKDTHLTIPGQQPLVSGPGPQQEFSWAILRNFSNFRKRLCCCAPPTPGKSLLFNLEEEQDFSAARLQDYSSAFSSSGMISSSSMSSLNWIGLQPSLCSSQDISQYQTCGSMSKQRVTLKVHCVLFVVLLQSCLDAAGVQAKSCRISLQVK